MGDFHSFFRDLTMTGQDSNMCDTDPAEATWDRIFDYIEQAEQRFQFRKKFGLIQSYAGEHPTTTLIVVVTLALACIPIICFIGFVLGSMILTLLGFVLVEGTLLTVGGSVLMVALAVVAFFSVTCCLLGMAFWMALQYTAKMLQSARQTAATRKIVEPTTVVAEPSKIKRG